ncbi:protein lethal, putative [Pediculus humanus corporis]|uniref:Protein lethal, putative n=1 Tax=Pediculus humanus subsp. corporis TaxID=121224 RepID=E0VC65_PEDHC|nr:protein lethal, putative [Pediculus humanus corporis]EEB10971.1 protein lethal, putative [Pediculus humanus corporis]
MKIIHLKIKSNKIISLMSLVPYLLTDVLDDLTRPSSIFDQNFGLGLLQDDLINPRALMRMPLSRGYLRPWRHVHGRDSGVSNITSNENEFKINLDVQQFPPECLNVKVVDNSVIVEGKHEERADEHGYISRQFTRRYVLPDNVDPSTVVSNLSSDGVLTVAAPKKIAPAPANERVVPIVHTQQPAIKSGKQTNQKAGGDAEKMEQ